MLQYIQFSNPVSDIFSSDGAHLDSHDTVHKAKDSFRQPFDQLSVLFEMQLDLQSQILSQIQ